MGTWGYNSFDNDDAMMWSDDCVASRNSTAFIKRSLTSLSADSEAVDARRAIAAAELIAKARGHGAREIPEELLVWLDESDFVPTVELKKLAILAVQQILDESELRELWRGQNGWLASCRRLIERLKRAAKKRKKPNQKQTVPERGTAGQSQSAVTKFIRENKGFVIFSERQPETAGLEPEAKNPKAMLEAFSQLPTVESVTVSYHSFDAADLVPLTRMPNLHRLDVSKTNIGDELLEIVADIAELSFLDISFTEVSDKGLPFLSRCKSLRTLDIGHSRVTEKAVAKLQQALPKLKDIDGVFGYWRPS